MSETRIIVGRNAEGVSVKLYDYLLPILKSSERKAVTIGLSGGSMPKMVAPLLGKMESMDWDKVKFFVVDERMVPLSDEASNTGAFLRLLPSRFKSCFLEYGPIDDTKECATNYANQLGACRPDLLDGWPLFDLLLLGLGPDGHTCSLFPGHSLLQNETDWVAPIEDSPKPPPRRITLTLPVICRARNVAFICLGSDKAQAVKATIRDHDLSLPSARIAVGAESVCWFLDAAAASLL